MNKLSNHLFQAIRFLRSYLTNGSNFIKAQFFLDTPTSKFISHNNTRWGSWVNASNQNEVLVDFNPTPESILGFSYISNILAKKFEAQLVGFQQATFYPDFIARRIYKSFNVKSFVEIMLTEKQQKEQTRIFKILIKKIRSKQDLIDLKIKKIWIGIDIYETYLRHFSEPTVDITDERLHNLVFEAIAQIIYWEDYLKSHSVKAIVVSHDTYIYLDILCKLAYQSEIPVYYQNIHELVMLDKPFTIFGYFPYLKKIFASLSTQEQMAGRQLARQRLEKRMSGVIGSEISYMKISPFSKRRLKRVIQKSNRPKVLICSHCFFDNPYAYGPMLFSDFYGWLEFLGKISMKTDYDWYLKVHPGSLPRTVEVIEKFLNDYPNIKLVPETVSHHQLAKEGIRHVLTVHGSVGHEYPLLGAQVINAGYNPHMAYDFNWNPTTKKDYGEKILNLPSLDKQVRADEIYEFYFMRHHFMLRDDLIFISYRDSLNSLPLEDRTKSATYEFFLKQATDLRHQQIIDNISDFVNSNKHYFTANGPMDLEDYH